MKQPITVNVSREFGNSGDVVVTITDANNETMKLGTPGEGSTYEAVSALRPFLEGALNGHFEPTDGTPHLVTNTETDEVHIMVSNVDVTGPIPAKLIREQIAQQNVVPASEPPPSTPRVTEPDSDHTSDVVAPTPVHVVEHDLDSTPDVTK